MLIDYPQVNNSISVKCLGIDFPFAVFPFRISLRYNFPTVVVWLSKIKGKGYKLNIREVIFTTVNEGVIQYANILEEIVKNDPCLWRTEIG